MADEQVGMTRLLHLIQAEYRESPGLNLTKQQMQRLWGLEPRLCDELLEQLLRAHVLRPTAGGTFVSYTVCH